MFAIYNMQGRAFRDSLEALKKVRQPHSVEDSQLQEDVAKDETIIIQGKDSPESLANANSVNAYRKMLHANERTVIVHAYQIMTHPVATLSSQITVAKAYEDFEKQQVNQFPVYTPQMTLIGMVSRLEVLQAYYSNPNQPLEALLSKKGTLPFNSIKALVQLRSLFNFCTLLGFSSSGFPLLFAIRQKVTKKRTPLHKLASSRFAH